MRNFRFFSPYFEYSWNSKNAYIPYFINQQTNNKKKINKTNPKPSKIE